MRPWTAQYDGLQRYKPPIQFRSQNSAQSWLEWGWPDHEDTVMGYRSLAQPGPCVVTVESDHQPKSAHGIRRLTLLHRHVARQAEVNAVLQRVGRWPRGYGAGRLGLTQRR